MAQTTMERGEANEYEIHRKEAGIDNLGSREYRPANAHLLTIMEG